VGHTLYRSCVSGIAVLFIPGLNIYAAGFLSGMIGSKGDLKQGILSALTAGFNAKVLHPMKAGFNKLIAHGITGGVRSRLSGGSFKSGFLGLAVSYGASWSGAYEAAGGCINPAVNAPNIPCFKSLLLPIMPNKNSAT
jgi:hypothetical protein